jgi:hypothetical protein
MARRSGTSHKCVEEKRRQLPIYQHYTLSPGKTKSHHPEARCIHCHKEFVCGSKQRLIRHIRKCNSISNPEQIIAETLNTLARNSATGQLNHSILEASNLLPSQISQIQHSATQQLVGQAIQQNSPTNSTVTTATNSTGNNSNNGSNISHNTSGSGDQTPVASTNSMPSFPRKTSRRGRKPGGQNSIGPGIHVTTGVDGKTHFLPASQLTQVVAHGSPQIINSVHNGRVGQINYAYQATVASTTTAPATNITATGAHINTSNSGHLPCATPNHHSSPFKLNSELIDKAYLKLVLTRNLPLSLCDTKEFQAWLKTFANDYKPPSSINLIAQNLKHEAQSAKYRVNNILAKAPKKTINLELHHWPDEIRGHSWYAMIAGIDHKRFLISVRDLLGQLNQRALVQNDDVSADKLFNEFIDENVKRVGSDRINSLILAGKKDSDFIIEHARQSLYTTHPSIVTYHCWWYFTNQLCSDIFEHNESFKTMLRNSTRLIHFINHRPQLSSHIEKFGPFAGASGTLYQRRDNNRWFSHLVCYLFQYLKNNNESITRLLENYSPSNFSFYNNNDNNNNNSTATGPSQSDARQNRNASTQSNTPGTFTRNPNLEEVKSIVMSSDYWATLNSALVYLKSFQDIVALAPTFTGSQISNGSTTPNQVTPVISPTMCNNLSLSEYMNWILKYGKSLIDNWKRSSDQNTYQLIDKFLSRFLSSIKEFKLLFAAYLLNPKYRCAYMTQKAKDSAIEEILNIASEFMPEESDGHTIFDQWKLYLVREEPYDMAFDESRTSPLEWWMSLPCAESIRRVALRILRLRSFSSPKPENLFAPLYFYEDETKSNLIGSCFEDLATLRYFYDHEDRISQANIPNPLHNHNSYGTNNATNSHVSNGFIDRTHAGFVHVMQLADAENPEKFLPLDLLESQETNGQYDIKYKELSIVDTLDDTHSRLNDLSNAISGDLENLPNYKLFCSYIDFSDSGIRVVTEEPIEKKKRKWTAQEILSKCQANHHNSNYNNNHEIQQK